MPPNEQETQETGFKALSTHVKSHKIEVFLWLTRIVTMLSTFSYFFPIFTNPHSAYIKALVANAATSALRLHQRQPELSLSRETLFSILLEDSCHYLIYSLIFLYVSPFPLVLVPIFLFSLVHFASYSLTLLDKIGQNSWWGARLLISLVELQSRKILSLIALTEIIMLPISLVLLILGRASLPIPFFYSQFLMMRYKSQRNPYTRNMFSEMRIMFEGFASKPSTPSFVRVAIDQLIQFISRCAPPLPHQSAQ